jgi:SHS2 domain-containing protein
MGKFVISDRFTTADIGLDLEADSLEGLFETGANGMFAIILGEQSRTTETVKKTIKLESETIEQLLVDWLSELLYLFDTDDLIAQDYQIDLAAEDDNAALRGKVDFRSYNRDMDAAEHEIKAVTYYKLKVEREGGVYRCHVVFDL